MQRKETGHPVSPQSDMRFGGSGGFFRIAAFMGFEKLAMCVDGFFAGGGL